MFLILRACLLWGLVSLHVVGGAALFRRLFPRESPWLGFIVPPLALVLLLNFVEHGIAVPSLAWAFPFTSLGAIWLLMGRVNWRVFRLPTGIFLCAFAFTLLLRALKPDIAGVRDGVLDLHLVANYCMGGTLPATSTWLPPIKLTNYYAFEHYGASVLIRLFNLDMGTGFNVSAALLAAFILFLAGAIAWRLSEQRAWIAIVSVVLTACATTGSTAYLFLSIKDLNPEDTANLFNRMDDASVHIPLWDILQPVTLYNRRELFVPGSWAWTGCFHSTSAGQFLTLVSTYALVEIFHRRRTDWPWIVLAGTPLLMLVCCSWGVPLLSVFFLVGLGWAAALGLRPFDLPFVVRGVAAMGLSLTPMLLYFLAGPFPAEAWASGEQHTQLVEFVLQWWPVLLPWVAFLFIWRELPPPVRIVHLIVPIGLVMVESYTFGARFDMTGKSWGFLYAAAWTTFLPVLLKRRGLLGTPIVVLMVASSIFAFAFWSNFYYRTVWPEDVGHLAGAGPVRTDHKKAKLFQALRQLHHEIVLTGKSAWQGCTSPMLANLTGNSDWVTWAFDCDVDVYRDTLGEAGKREKIVNQIYAGTYSDPLGYLRQHHIAALVIWPDDNIPDDALARMQQQLAPDYIFTNFRDEDTPDPPNVGIFTLRAPSPGGAPGLGP